MRNNIEIASTFKVVGIQRRTSAWGFNRLMVGSTFTVHVPLVHTKITSRVNARQPELIIAFPADPEITVIKTFNQLVRILDSFILVPVDSREEEEGEENGVQ